MYIGAEQTRKVLINVGQYVIHLAHATQAINPQEFTLRKKTIKKYGMVQTAKILGNIDL